MAGQERPAPITVEDLHERLRVAVEAIESGDQWRRWLDVAKRLHRYSFNNVVLIMTQCPDASAVASYTTWQAAHRQVRRGERAIKIMAPILRRTRSDDTDGEPSRNSGTGRVVKPQVVGFRTASVFDIGQTDGAPLSSPEPPRLLEGQAPAGLWDALAREIAERGYRLLRGGEAKLGTANGSTDPHRREVTVRDDLDDLQAAKTLAHELAHVILHADDDTDEIGCCRGIVEVEAESVAFLVLGARGAPTDSYSFPYVTHWAYPVAAVEHVAMVDVVARTGRRVTDAARTILEGAAIPPTDDAALSALARRTVVAATKTATLLHEIVLEVGPVLDSTVLHAVVEDSHAYFVRHAATSWVPTYLRGRNLNDVRHVCGIGHAPRGWTTLTNHLRLLGYSDDHIEAAGMAVRARNGQLVDRLRDRLTIPVRDQHGSITGFTARAHPHADTDTPKYLNTPSTPIFEKGSTLYGFAEYRAHSSKGCSPVLCEGAIDAIAINLAASAAGHTFAGVAPCGTAFTDRQAALLSESGATVVLAFDDDAAGRAATEGAWRLLTDHGPRPVMLAQLPAGADPADLATTDPAHLIEVLRVAVPAATALADRKITEAGIDDNPLRQVLAFRELVGWQARIPEVDRVPFALHLADRLNIDPCDAARETAEHGVVVGSEESINVVVRHCEALLASVSTTSATDVDAHVNDVGQNQSVVLHGGRA